MNTQEVKRKLTAILSADVKGYSRLMGEDERGTVGTLNVYKEVMIGLIQLYHGRVVDAPGDSVLAEFGSVVDAVQCAVEIQKELKTRNDDLPENRKMEFRIGINLGDVIEEGDKIFGDGVNITARIEGLADGGGICISGSAFEQVKSKLKVGYEYLGEQSVKNIAEKVRVYRVLMEPEAGGSVIYRHRKDDPRHKRRATIFALLILIAGAAAIGIWNFYWRAPKTEPVSKAKMAFPLPDKPSIAVLPFVNMSGDPEQEFFSDGMTEEIITALSKSPYLFVIARNSTFTYKGKSVKVEQVSEELGVRYVLEGSVRRSGEKVRVTAQLIDAMKGHHLWSERYDRDLKDIFALQDEIAFKIMKTVHEKLELAYSRTEAKKVGNVEAYLKIVEYRRYIDRSTKEDNPLARKLVEEAIALDPAYALPYVALAWTHMIDFQNGWTKSPMESLGRAIELGEKAIALDESDASAHASLGYFYVYAKQFNKAVAHAERGLALDPNSSDVLFNSGVVLACSGRPEEAIPLLHKAIRLNPFAAASWFCALSLAYRLADRFDEAVEQAKKALERDPKNPLAYLALASGCILAGREREARFAAAKLIKIYPAFSVEQVTLMSPFKDKSKIERDIDAYRKAGLK